MGCYKTLTLSGGCVLDTCETKDRVLFVSPQTWMSDRAMAYAKDLCYLLVVTMNNAGTLAYFNRYDPATNTLILKTTYAANISEQMVAYDAAHHVFVCTTAGSDLVLIFDPATDTITSFNSGVTGPGASFALFYIPEKGHIYGHFGEDGTGQHYIGYIDVDLMSVVQLGVVPGIGAQRPYGYNLAYSPVADAIYGCWITGISAGLLKFDLATNTCNPQVLAFYAAHCCWDTSRNRLLCFYGFVYEVDTVTDTLVYTSPYAEDIRFYPSFVSDTGRVLVHGYDIAGDNTIYEYDTTLTTTSLVFDEYKYYSSIQLSERSFFSNTADKVPGDPEGFRRLCVPL